MEDATKDVTNQLCRLRLIVNDRSVEMALPTDVALVDLLPAILRHAGTDLADEGVEHEGWVLQRLGKAPFDENRTTSELGLVDGETVHLRPRAASLPAIDFDDLVDGLAEQARRRSDKWNDRLSRWMLLTFGGLALVAGVLALLLDGPALPRTLAASATAIILLIAGTAIARASGDAVTGTVLSGLALPYAALGGWLLPHAIAPNSGVPVGLTCLGVFTTAALVLGLVGVADAALLFVSGLFAVIPLTITAVIDTASPADAVQAAGIGLLLSLLVLGFVPTSSFRLAGLSLPALPTSSEEFGQDTEPVPHEVVIERSVVADQYMAGLYTALGVVYAVLFGVLVSSGEMWPMITVAVAGLLLLLRSRHIDSARQRWALLGSAGFGLVIDATALAGLFGPVARIAFVFSAALVFALGLVIASRSLPGRKLRPYWGRAVDLLETTSALALIPLLLAVLNLYMYARGLAG